MINGKRIIAVCISVANSAGSYKFIEAINNVFSKRDYKIFIYETNSDLYWNTKADRGECKVFDLIDYNIVDAVVVFSQTIMNGNVLRHIYDTAIDNNVPVICVDGEYEGCTSVYLDYKSGITKMMHHLIDVHDVRDFHFIAGNKGNSYSEERIDAFREVLYEYDIPYEDSMLSYGDFWSGPTRESVRQLIEEHRIPRAIVCANDVMAMVTCTTLQQNGYRIPEDVIVTGLDGLDEVMYATPSISTSFCDYDEMAETLYEILSDAFSGKPYGNRYMVDFKLQVAGSCGCHYNNADFSAIREINRINDRFNLYRSEEGRINEIALNAQICDTFEEFKEELKKMSYSGMMCFVNEQALDNVIDPIKNVLEVSPDIKLRLLYDGLNLINENEVQMDSTDIERCFLGKIMNSDWPLIICMLNSLDNPLGFTCFHLKMDFDDYCKFPQYVLSLNNAIGGYRNLRYQQHMTEFVEELYQNDLLTGLLNRTGFSRKSEKFIQKVKKSSDKCLMVVSVDVDHLKMINDGFGHEAGDFAIKTVADAMKYTGPEEKLPVRYGGDEMFVVASVSPEIDVEMVKKDIYDYIDKVNAMNDKPYTVSASVGVFVADPEEISFEEMLKESDIRMYLDKTEKRASRR